MRRERARKSAKERDKREQGGRERERATYTIRRALSLRSLSLDFKPIP